jgi:hypothetical protein
LAPTFWGKPLCVPSLKKNVFDPEDKAGRFFLMIPIHLQNCTACQGLKDCHIDNHNSEYLIAHLINGGCPVVFIRHSERPSVFEEYITGYFEYLIALDVCTVHFVELYYICPTNAQYILISVS